MKRKIAIIGVLLLIPTLAFSAETIYTWGYGDVLAHILESVADFLKTDDYKGLFKIFLSMGLLLVVLSYLGSKHQDPFTLIKFYAITIGIWYVLLAPSVVKTNVYIDDKQNPNYSQVVQDVPYVIAKILSWFSIFEKVIAEKMEVAFSVPNGLTYSNTGFLTAFGVMANANSHKIIDPYLYLSVNDYINDCVFPDIVDGSKDVYTLARSNHLWDELGNTNPSRITKYYSSSNPDGVLKNCDDAYSLITSDLNKYIQNLGLQSISNIIGGFSSSQINLMLGTASDYYLNYSVTGQAYLQQSVSMNMFSEAFQNFAKVNGIDSAGLALGAAKAEETARNNMVLSGVLGAKYIPVIKGVLTSLITGLIPILILLLVTPLFKRVFFGFLMILGWLSLWHVSEVLVNAIINIKASEYLSNLANGNYNLLIKGAVDGTILDYINLVSSFYWAIPTISFLIASGFSIYAMNSLSGQMSGKAQGATGSVAGEMATGSINTSSNISTGRNWNFGSFSQIGNSMAMSFGYTGNWGAIDNIHAQTSGLIGNLSPTLNQGSIQEFNTAMSKVLGSSFGGLNLGDGKITGAVGRKDGNTYELQAGMIGDSRILKGTSFNVDRQGRISGHLKLADSNGRVWDLEFNKGQLVHASSNSGGEKIDYRHSRDGKDYVTMSQTDGVKGGFVFDSKSDTVADINMPDKVNAKDAYEQSINQNIRNLTSLTDSKKIADSYKSGNTYVKSSLLDYAYKVGSDEKYRGSEAQKFVQSSATSALESTIKNLSNSNEQVIKGGHKIDDESKFQRELHAKGAIELNDTIAGKLLNKISGLNAELGGNIAKAWVGKDSIYVETSDGTHYKFDLTKKAQEEYRKNFGEELTTDKAHSTGYSEEKGTSARNAEEYRKQQESFFSQVAELAKQDVKQLENAKSLAERKGMDINKDLTRHLVDVLHDMTGKGYSQILREINENPSKFNELLNNKDLLRDIANRISGNVNNLDYVNEVQGKADKINMQTNTDETILNKAKENSRINKDFEMVLEDIDKLDHPVNKVGYNQFTDEDTIKSANQHNIKKENADKAFNTAMANKTQQRISNAKNTVGLTPELVNGARRLKQKYGDDIKGGLDAEKYRINEEVNKLNKEYGYNFSLDDIKSGKALKQITEDFKDKLEASENTIKTYEQMRNNSALWNALDDKTKANIETGYKQALQDREKYSRLVGQVLNIQNRNAEYEKDLLTYRNIERAGVSIDKITYGEKPVDGFGQDPHKEINYPDYKPSTHSPQYSYGNRTPEAPGKPNYIGGPTGYSNQQLYKDFKAAFNGTSLKQEVVRNLSNNPEVKKIRDNYLNMFTNHSALGDEVVKNLRKFPR